MKRTATAATAATLAALAVPQAAGASTIEVTASAGPAASEYIYYRVSSGERNNVQVLMKGNALVLVDRGTRRIRPKRNAGFGNCRNTSARRVVCPNFPLFANLRDGNDRMTVAPGDAGSAPESTDPLSYEENYEDTEGAVVETLYVQGGAGDDVITGSKFNDVFVPGPGADRVDGRAGPDQFYDAPDGQIDSFNGNGGVDAVDFNYEGELSIDLRTDLGGPNGEFDKVKRIERAHGGEGRDDIRGSFESDALYGDGGDDQIFGRGGNDLVVGDSPIASNAGFNTLSGDEGDDILDTRAVQPRGSLVDCGPGSDRHMGGTDTRLDASCEFALLRVAFGSGTTPDFENVLYDDPMKLAPVAKTSDSVTFEVPCPQRRNAQCSGTVTLESPPSSTQPTTHYGVGEFGGPAGSRGNVTVGLNAAGQAAVASDEPVAVRVHIDFAPPDSGTIPAHADAGWQADL